MGNIFFGRPLKPETAEDTKAVETVAGMRKRLREYARDEHLVHRIFIMCEQQGLSGEDTMTTLAYYALLDRESLREKYMDYINTHPNVEPIVVPR